jgi:chemotaxis protein methyltransferase CheR
MTIPTAHSATRHATDADEFVAFCVGVRELTDLDLLRYKRRQMERRIRAFAERKGAPALADYLELLRRDPEELNGFLDRVTINVSQLWRNPEQWRLLEREVLPELAARGRLRIWSAGCSYGAEAYTAAALCRTIGATGASILGTDVDRRMIARAREGVFSDEDARTAPPEQLARFFDRHGDGWRANAALRALVRFEVADLFRQEPAPGSYDLILCRNVVIYFNEPDRDALHALFADALRPGGYLVVGSTERVACPRELGLEPAHPFTYRKA